MEQESESPRVEHISGSALLDNNAVNLVSAFFMCLLTPKIALYVWSNFVPS